MRYPIPGQPHRDYGRLRGTHENAHEPNLHKVGGLGFKCPMCGFCIPITRFDAPIGASNFWLAGWLGRLRVRRLGGWEWNMELKMEVHHVHIRSDSLWGVKRNEFRMELNMELNMEL